MAKAGRKRQTGKRFPGGKLVPAMRIDRGTAELHLQHARSVGMLDDAAAKAWSQGRADEAVAMVANDGRLGQAVDPVGRAWVAGLLDHPGATAEAMRDAGRVVFKLYWAHYAQLCPRDALASIIPGGGGSGNHDSVEAALNRRLEAVDAHGRAVRQAIESMCIDWYFDTGPRWLDRMILAKRDGSLVDTADWALLRYANEGLAELAKI